jgi:hypothetical protein
MFEWLAGKVFGLITGGMLTPIANLFGKYMDAKSSEFAAAVKGDQDVAIAGIQAQAQLASMRWGSRLERALYACAAFPPILHSGAVYIDSTFKFGWNIPRAPGLYEGNEFTIIAAVLGIISARSIGGGFISYLHK